MKNVFKKLKYGLGHNKITTILALGLIIPLVLIISLKEKNVDNILMTFLIVPIVYRLIGRVIIKMLVKAGKNESTDYFIIATRIVAMVVFFVVALIANASGAINYPFLAIVLLSIAMGYFDKFVFIVIGSLFHISAEGFVYGNPSSVDSVDVLLGKSANSYTQPDGTVIYKDSTGKTIGSSKYDEKTGETTYWNESLGYVGKSTKGVNNSKEYYDKDINYKGKSVKENDGTTSYYDEKSNYAGKSVNNSDGTSTYHKN